MNDDAATAEAGGAAVDGSHRAVSPRPWTLAAAMEPVPPLAPPPARPGKGVAVVTQPRPPAGAPGAGTVVAVAVLVAVVAVVVIVLLALGR